ncbi:MULTISPECIES: transcriptional antiterminator [unclassified Gilliamella]|uniref:transcriptional antiterminator n=1 Tax=unclassified Gilliamella TaxID=2685620 RepID=UPI001321266C|nr:MULTISPECIES: transcriptional antiterminator [unclassified Gilliamella]MWN32228.1 transcriptional antiterminator [Gilliamella sp. Pra-s60]MWP29450.1 transcriptional antiterminator [Gilliamella sp. Pra-s54]
MNQIKFRMIEDNLDPELVTKQTIEIINGWLSECRIFQNDVQKAMLYSHIKAMVERAKTLEKLPEVDPTLFDEISEESLLLARKTVKLFSNLPMEEAYLLAVHYEVAKEN